MSDGRVKEAPHRAVGVAAAPPPGQVIGSNAGPPSAQVAGDAELEQKYERKLNRWSSRNFFVVALVTVAANFIKDAGWMRLLPAYMVCYAAATLIEYWFPPRPPERFLPWALKVVGIFLNFYVGLVTLPALLRNSLPTPLAHGLPVFAFCLVIYYVPPLYPVKRKTALWKWVVGSAAFAALWGLVGYYSVT